MKNVQKHIVKAGILVLAGLAVSLSVFGHCPNYFCSTTVSVTLPDITDLNPLIAQNSTAVPDYSGEIAKCFLSGDNLAAFKLQFILPSSFQTSGSVIKYNLETTQGQPYTTDSLLTNNLGLSSNSKSNFLKEPASAPKIALFPSQSNQYVISSIITFTNTSFPFNNTSIICPVPGQSSYPTLITYTGTATFGIPKGYYTGCGEPAPSCTKTTDVYHYNCTYYYCEPLS